VSAARRIVLGGGLALGAVAAALGATASSATPPARSTGTFLVTQYFPVSERWFTGRPVRARGLPGRYR
jgi:hypothetical protein